MHKSKLFFDFVVFVATFCVLASSTYSVTHDHSAHASNGQQHAHEQQLSWYPDYLPVHDDDHEREPSRNVTQECVLCCATVLAEHKTSDASDAFYIDDNKDTCPFSYAGIVIPSLKQIDPLEARAPPTPYQFS